MQEGSFFVSVGSCMIRVVMRVERLELSLSLSGSLSM